MKFTRADFAANLRARRARLDLTQDELGERIGRSKVAISLYESGKRLPGLEVAARLADALKMTLDDLLSPDISSIRDESGEAA